MNTEQLTTTSPVIFEPQAALRQAKNEAAIHLLDTWIEEGDEQEQKETWDYLQEALDEDRLSARKLFP